MEDKNTIKTIAMYLPQFHQVKENDEWWGYGYTEWTAVKAADSLFEGHTQPKCPKDGDYYDLSQKETMYKQAQLMNEYGIDGLCFYHYYFKDGRKLLEKPAENLLQWKDINMPFCFCWANPGWARTWSKIKNSNFWTDKFEKVGDSHDDGVLAEQKYGRKEDWIKHFEYLLPFFKDERYIKKDGMPIVLIYDPNGIACLYQMTECWRQLARANGFNDIYFIGNSVKKEGLDAVFLHAPTSFFCKVRPDYKGENRVATYPYKELWSKIIAAKSLENCRTYFAGFVNYDDTPRRGTKGIVTTGFSMETFKENLFQLFCKNLAFGNEFLFINAWNEWAEGMYLEPDEEYGFGYLEAVRDAKEKALAEDIDEKLKNRWLPEEQTVQEKGLSEKLDKQTAITKCLDDWMSLKEKGIAVADYLKRYNYNRVAIYGMGILGRHLLYDLEHSDVNVLYVIDRRANLDFPGYKVKSPEDEYEQVDAIVVTAVADFKDIYDTVVRKIQCPILSIQELLEE